MTKQEALELLKKPAEWKEHDFETLKSMIDMAIEALEVSIEEDDKYAQQLEKLNK